MMTLEDLEIIIAGCLVDEDDYIEYNRLKALLSEEFNDDLYAQKKIFDDRIKKKLDELIASKITKDF